MDDFLWFKDRGHFCGCENKIGMKGAELLFVVGELWNFTDVFPMENHYWVLCFS